MLSVSLERSRANTILLRRKVSRRWADHVEGRRAVTRGFPQHSLPSSGPQGERTFAEGRLPGMEVQAGGLESALEQPLKLEHGRAFGVDKLGTECPG